MSDTRKRKAAVEQAHKHISRAIYLREVLPSHRLPSANELSQEIGVSRPSVLEALKILSKEGVVQINRGRTGVEVLPSVGTNRKKRLDWLDANRETVVEMVLIREMVEPGIVRIVASREVSESVRRALKKT